MSDGPATVGWFVPGRVEVLGKHTDYAGGRSLLAAVDRGHTVRATARPDQILHVRSTLSLDAVEIDLDAPETVQRLGAGHWSGYVHGVVDRLRANFPDMLRGADITIDSDLPLAAGMSSSSALVVGLAMTMIELAGIDRTETFRREVPDRERLSEYLGTVENGQSYGRLEGHRGVGTFGGSEDHTAMLCGRPDALVQYAFCPVRFERQVPLPPGLALVVGVSGVEAEKTGAAKDLYNRVSLSAREILALWNRDTGREDLTLGDAVRSSERAGEQLRRIVGEGGYLPGRLAQFLAESEEIIPAAAQALADGDLPRFGDLVDRSQHLAEVGLQNQVPETVTLQQLARQLGAHAASAFGAGFGGSVWALVEADGADAFATEWFDRYAERHPGPANAATWLVTRPGASAHRLEA
ncbi:galactokinase [Brachybacterium sp. EF45031]|uniref:GHMP family kinase ATP-binding protein n=1 Tax=Brachybacterium sillae TaxID=2810536 RepID=UPI00217E0979|nr:galactokinase family protein [Brachybacterium sillae]MCS6711711.1 galactokinase [Brachybacterium sillae]